MAELRPRRPDAEGADPDAIDQLVANPDVDVVVDYPDREPPPYS